MAQAGYTPIQLYYSTTASAAPSSGNLANGELAINITDGKLYYKDNGGTVRVLAGTGGTGVVAGSNTQVQFNNNGVFGASANLTWDGTYLTVNSLKDSALTSGRVTFAGASGLLQDSANLTFDGTTLTANALTVTNATTLSAGTANGVAYLNASNVLTTGSALTFDGTNLGVGASSSVKLGVTGSAGTYSATSNNTQLVILTNNKAAATGNYAGLGFAASAGDSAVSSAFIGIASPATGYAPDIVFQRRTGASTWAEHARLSAAGGLSIGTTTDAGAGGLRITGNAVLGDASTDTVTVNGYMGVGGAANAGYGLNVASTALTGTTQVGLYSQITSTSAATSSIRAITARASTAAASFTTNELIGGYFIDAIKGAGSTIANQHGVLVNDQTQGTNNYGITSLVSSGTNKWNIYASGTAANYFAGNVQVNSASLVLSGSGAPVGTNPSLYRVSGDAFVIATNTAERLRIDSSGNLGLGVTPSAKLDVAAANFVGGPAIGARYNTGNARIGFNIANANGFPYIGYNTNNTNGSDTPTYDLSQAATQLRMDGGQFRFNTATSGTAGAAITFTQAMTLDASGNLLVGLTSATGVAKLQISGPLRTTGYTVATLPAGTVGMRTYVTDALAPSFGATVVGGGTVTIPVFYNGTNWIVA